MFPFKFSGDYARALSAVFDHQSESVKASIIGQAIKLPWLPESQITIGRLHDYTDQQLLKIAKAGGVLPGGKQDPAQFVAHVRSGLLGWRPQPGAKTDIGTSGPGYGLGYTSAYQKAAKTAGYVIDPKSGKPAYPVKASLGDLGGPASVFNIPGEIAQHPVRFLEHAYHDTINLPANTVQGFAGLVDQVGQGHVGNAFHMLIDPYVHAFMHPQQAFLEHPVNTALLTAGPKFVAGKAAGDVARTGMLGAKAKAFAATERAPLVSPTGAVLEARSYSPNLLRKAGQVRRESQVAKRVDPATGKPMNPNVARPAAKWVPDPIRRSFNIGLAAKEQRIAHEVQGVSLMSSREARGQAMHTMDQTGSLMSPEAQGIAAHVLQNVIRTPQSAWHDLHAELGRLQAIAPTLKGAEKTWNYKQQEALSAAIRKPQAIGEAFHAVNGDPAHPGSGLRGWFNSRDTQLVQRNLLHPDQALRAKLFPYAQAHMGAYYNHTTRQLVAHNGAPLPTEHILAHMAHNGHAEVRYDPNLGMVRDHPNPEHQALVNRAANAANLGRRAGTVGEQQAALNGLRRLQTRLKETPASRTERLAHDQAPLGHGLQEPAYVGHYPGRASAANFFSGYRLSRGVKSNHPRTGEAFRKGFYNHTWEGLRGQAAKAEGALAKSSLHDTLVGRTGINKIQMNRLLGNRVQHPITARERQSAGFGRFTPEEAAAAAHVWLHDEHGKEIPGRQPLVGIVERPQQQTYSLPKLDGSGDHVVNPIDLHGAESAEFHTIQQGLENAKVGSGNTARNVVLIPKSVADATLAHAQRLPPPFKQLGQLTQRFRGTVLPYSLHWMTQIGTEALLRGGVSGALTPFNRQAGRALFQRLEKTPQGRKALQEMINATFWKQHEAFSRHNPDMGTAAQLWHQAPTHYISDAHNKYSQFIGSNMGKMETSFRKMGMGKLARDQVREWNNGWRKSVKLQGQNLEHLAQQLETNPALVAKFGRSIDTTFGKYNKFSPTTRNMIQSFAPFLPWYLNAAKFVLYHLPHNHPVAQSLTTSLAQWAQNEQQQGKQLPLDKFRAAELARLSPWGLLVTHDPFDPLLSPFLPQGSGAYNILRGLNKFGTGPLRGPGKVTEGQRVGPALQQLLESFIPLSRDVKVALAEHGRPAYDTSTFWNPQPKPGTHGSVGTVANKILNPFHTLQPGGPAPKKGSAHTNVLSSVRRGQDTSLLLHPDRVGPDGRIIKTPPKTKGSGGRNGWGGTTAPAASSPKGWG